MPIYVFLPPEGKANGMGAVSRPAAGTPTEGFVRNPHLCERRARVWPASLADARRNLARPLERLDDRQQTNGPRAPISLVDAGAGYSTRRTR